MRREARRSKSFIRRAVIFAGGQLALFGVLAGRLYYLQVIDADQYKMLAEENRINLVLLPPPRGRVLDRFGVQLAGNRQNYRALLVPEQTGDVGETLSRLGALVPIGDWERRRILREVERKRRFVPITVTENLSWAQFSRINVYSPDLPGIQPDVGETRYYPYGTAFAHVVGYVAPVSEDELGGDPLLELPGFRIGKNGIERVYDLDLRGKAGNSRVEVNAYGRVIRELARRDGEPGDDIVLTIDAGLQQFISNRLGQESAACVVLDVHNGEVLALASTPGFDPNDFNIGLSQSTWRNLMDDDRKPLINKAINGQYPPGSTFKMIVALAGLESGTLSESHRVFCPGFLTLGDRTFHCWKKQGHGEMNVTSGIVESCDVFFFDAAQRIGVDRIEAMARRFGFGETLGIELPSEKAGLLPTRAWKEAVYGVPWQRGETLNTGIGQGYVLATPLQLAVMVARLANGGKAVKPTLVRGNSALAGEAGAEAEEPPSLGLTRQALELVQDAMVRVSNSRRGTAFASRVRHADFPIAGKTGTSQVRRISQIERQQKRPKEDRPWAERDHALFVAYAPADAPRYAIAVLVEHGGSAARTAAPIARDILLELRRRDPSARTPYQTSGRHSAQAKRG